MPGLKVTWDVLDHQKAVASICDRRTSASLLFHFNRDDEVSDILSPARYRAAKDGFVLTPWAVRCREYFDVDGVRIPRHCEVEWLLPEGPLTYWRGEVTRVRYQFDSTPAVRARALPFRPRHQLSASTATERASVSQLLAHV